jgi:hypothetical protein
MDISRERLDSYRRWLQALRIEFLNLPVEQQERFLPIAEKFIQDCRKLLDEARSVKERKVILTVDRVTNREDRTYIEGLEKETGAWPGIVQFVVPYMKNKPAIGDKVSITLFSLDGKTWYSSKEELITGR